MVEKLTNQGIIKEVIYEERKPIPEKVFEFLLGPKKGIKEKKKSSNPFDNPPLGTKHIVMKSMQSNVEAHYYWFLDFFQDAADQYGGGFYGANTYGKGHKDDGEIIKLRDLFTAAESSAYWGNIEARRSAQQDKFAQYMVNIGTMIKSMFPMIRELRLIDERLEFFKQSKSGDKHAETSLKTIWTDQVEGGTKTPTSIFALSGQPGYSTLPDLFFAINPKTSMDVEKEINKFKDYGINKRVKNILGNKLKQYLIWKEKVEKEFDQRKNFMTKYLRQHYHVIKLYLNWLRPYLRNIQRLQMQGTGKDPDLAAAFETNKVELELLGKINHTWKKTNIGDFEERFEFRKYYPCLRIRIKHLALPNMAYQKEYSRGAIHTGTTDIWFESFVATDKDIQEYQDAIDKEDFELIGLVNESIDALKEDLIKYLKEGGEEPKIEKKSPENKNQGLFEPFKALIEGFKEIIPKKGKGEDEPKKSPKQLEEEKNFAKSIAAGKLGRTHMIFKLTHGMYIP